MSVDLHLHTTASDGSMTPEELVEKAIELKYKAIAITDHDTVDGIEPALATASNFSLEVIPGIEINTNYKKNEVHILGYFINYKNKKFKKNIKYLKKKRKERVKKILDRLSDLGINISFSEIIKIARGGTIGRPHITRALIDHNYVDTWDESFEKYIGINAPAYVEREKLTSTEAINLIKKVGGKTVLAHPGFIENQTIINEIVEMGIEGLEVYYYEHSQREIEKYEKFALKNNLIITGGSDDHGPENKDGLRLGKICLDYSIVEKLKNN